MAITDDQGAVVRDYQYDVFGEVVGGSGSVESEFQFAGEQVDGSTGLQYLRSRYYDMDTGRFISRDPLSAMPGWVEHPYMYASANPVNLVDPGGLAPVPDDELRKYEQECLAGPSWSCYWDPGFWSSSPNPAPSSTPEPSSNEHRPTPEAEPLIPNRPKTYSETDLWSGPSPSPGVLTDIGIAIACVAIFRATGQIPFFCDIHLPVYTDPPPLKPGETLPASAGLPMAAGLPIPLNREK